MRGTSTQLNKRNSYAYLIALISLIVLQAPILLLGSGARFPIHDQFDGELLTYVLQAKHIGDRLIPELFDGVSKGSLQVPAPLFLVLYYFFSAETAYIIQYLIIVFCAFHFMYLLINKIIAVESIAAICAVFFAILPFFPVYGFTVMGQPMLLFAFICLINHEYGKVPYLLIILYASASSLVLVGYAAIGLIIVLVIGLAILHKPFARVLLGLVELVLSYILFNINLLLSVFGNKGYVTHKTEYVLQPGDVKTEIFKLFTEGHYHAASNHKIILCVAIPILVTLIIKKIISSLRDRKAMVFALLLMFAFMIALFYGVWRSEWVVGFRNRVGGLFISFQADRFYWLYPTLWLLLLAYVLYFILRFTINKKHVGKVVIGIVCMCNLIYMWNHSMLKVNFGYLTSLCNSQQYVDASSNTMISASVDEFFQPDMFQEIKRDIGLPQDEYRVCSVGLYPSIALYNGFYCVDGYSNNYDIDYKHEFRKIIANELDKDEGLQDYYDHWGNRCYVFSSELGKLYYINKTAGIVIKDLDVDYGRLSKMNCRYLLSSVKIKEEKNLNLIKKYTHVGSVYDVYLYEIRI